MQKYPTRLSTFKRFPMKVSVMQDDNFFYHDIELTSQEIRLLCFGSGIDQDFRYDLIGKKDLVICITKQLNDQEEESWKMT